MKHIVFIIGLLSAVIHAIPVLPPDGTSIGTVLEYECGIDSIPNDAAMEDVMYYASQWRVSHEWALADADSVWRRNGDYLSHWMAAQLLPETRCVSATALATIKTQIGMLLANTPCVLTIEMPDPADSTKRVSFQQQFYRCVLPKRSK